MKRILMLAMVMFAVLLFSLRDGKAQGQGWYMLDGGKCFPASDSHAGFMCGIGIQGAEYHSPAEFIKLYKDHLCDMMCSLHVSDVREGDKVVQVRIQYCACYYQGEECSITFYRLNRCQAAAQRERDREKGEQKRLKEYE